MSRGAPAGEGRAGIPLPHTPSPLTSASSCGPAEGARPGAHPRGGAAPGLFPHFVCRGLRSPILLAREKTQLDAPPRRLLARGLSSSKSLGRLGGLGTLRILGPPYPQLWLPGFSSRSF